MMTILKNWSKTAPWVTVLSVWVFSASAKFFMWNSKSDVHIMIWWQDHLQSFKRSFLVSSISDISQIQGRNDGYKCCRVFSVNFLIENGHNSGKYGLNTNPKTHAQHHMVTKPTAKLKTVDETEGGVAARSILSVYFKVKHEHISGKNNLIITKRHMHIIIW